MKLRYKRNKNEVDNIWSFWFEPMEPLKWTAGQSIRLEIPRAKYGTDERRFSIASAPYEKLIQITTKISGSTFKQNLHKLKPGDFIDGYNIEGDFIWGPSKRPRLFLAAGIGITPFRSMLLQRAHDKKPLNVTLVYSSKAVPLFKTEFDRLARTDPSLQVDYLLGGRIEISKKSTLAPFWLRNLVYISGPEEMVQDLSKQLVKQKLPKKQLRLDLFTGRVDY